MCICIPAACCRAATTRAFFAGSILRCTKQASGESSSSSPSHPTGPRAVRSSGCLQMHTSLGCRQYCPPPPTPTSTPPAPLLHTPLTPLPLPVRCHARIASHLRPRARAGGVLDFANFTGVEQHEFFTAPAAKQLYKDYVKAVLTRVNVINGRVYAEDPTIMAWCDECLPGGPPPPSATPQPPHTHTAPHPTPPAQEPHQRASVWGEVCCGDHRRLGQGDGALC
jgi:hypothetical protein